jgi:hypothetical protein
MFFIPTYPSSTNVGYFNLLSLQFCYADGMSDAEDEERALRINLMQTPIELYKAQLRWEPWKALAAMVAASAVFMGGVLAVSNWLHPATQPPPTQQFVLPRGTTIQIGPAPPSPAQSPATPKATP